jgi:DNA-binding NtrC family response regulator
MGSRVLVVDDEKLLRWSLRQALEAQGYQVDEAADGSAAIDLAAREPPDIVLLDYKLPDRTGLDVMQSLRRSAPRVPVVMITAHASLGGAVEATKAGAYDYVSKPFEIDDVLQTVERALEAGRLREEVAHHRQETLRTWGADAVVAVSPAMREIMELVRRVAASEAATVLILGESGVGKGLIARALHVEGAARDKPFMNITATALPEALLESELFGHERGAFTDAKVQKKGLFELADGGTVFLDEIGDLSPALQGKLLRFLEERAFRRVGGTRDIRVAVRVVAATNRRLAHDVEVGRFRRDLFFRLKVIPIEIPPLRERREDIPPLTERFLARFNAELCKAVGIDRSATELLQEYSWPGNVRELRNAIERAVLLADGDTIRSGDLPIEVRRGASDDSRAFGHEGFELPPGGLDLEALEKDLLRQALERTRGNRTRAARLLGINRDRIRYRIQKFHLEDAAASDG